MEGVIVRGESIEPSCLGYLLLPTHSNLSFSSACTASLKRTFPPLGSRKDSEQVKGSGGQECGLPKKGDAHWTSRNVVVS